MPFKPKADMPKMAKQWAKMTGNVKATKVHRSTAKAAAKKSGF